MVIAIVTLNADTDKSVATYGNHETVAFAAVNPADFIRIGIPPNGCRLVGKLAGRNFITAATSVMSASASASGIGPPVLIANSRSTSCLVG